MRLLAAILAIVVLAACGGDDEDGPAPSPSPGVTVVASAVPTEAALEPPVVGRQTLDGCPVEDEALCELAFELRDAVATGELESIGLVAEVHRCVREFNYGDSDVGCSSQDDTSVPVVAFFNYGSDCCYVLPEDFTHRLAVALGQPVDDSWRVWGIIERSPFWGGEPSVLLVRGVPQERQVIEFGTAGEGSKIGVAGLIRGTAGSLYVFPEADLLAWE